MPQADPVARKAYRRKWYLANVEKQKAHSRSQWQAMKGDATFREKARLRSHKYVAADPRRHLFQSVKGRAKRNGIPFALTLDEIVWPAKCPVLGLVLDYSFGTKGGKPKDNSPSLDRIVPAKGYVSGNVHVISNRANCIKSNATPAELMAVARFFEVFG